MKLIEVNNNGTSTFLLNDGRKIKSYQSGYVRIDNSYHDRLYQINKRIEVRDEYWTGYWHGKGYTDMDLTEKGKVESWALGQKRRQDLIIDQGFLNEELDFNEILVLSTNMDRTFNTAK